MGSGTRFRMQQRFDPFGRAFRADSQQPRPWAHGASSGAEFADEAVVPLRMLVEGEERSAGSWMEARHLLTAAFRPVGETGADEPLRFVLGGHEYVMFGRPRGFEFDVRFMRDGYGSVTAVFAALDPLIYDAEPHDETVTLPTYEGGLTFPTLVPFAVPGVQIGGRTTLVNAGTADGGLRFRLDGPVQHPRITLRHAGGAQTLTVGLDLAAGQWLDIDTSERTVYLDGLVSRRAAVAGEWPTLRPGTSEVRFRAAEHGPGTLTVQARSAWW
jgi:hypothetical protein